MNTDAFFYPPASSEQALAGLPRLMELAFRGVDLTPLREQLVARAQRRPDDANALMDLSTLMGLRCHETLSQQLQHEALSVSRRYLLAAGGAATAPRLRVLALMTPGSLMANIPIEFLLHGSDISLEMLYLPRELGALPLDLPPHDVACMAVCEAPGTRPLLRALAGRLRELPRPLLNDPLRVLDLARERAWELLHDAPGCLMPPSVLVTRAALQTLAAGADPGTMLPGWSWPITCRPPGSHAGNGLVRLAGCEALREHLAQTGGASFVISPFVDTIGADAQYRKMRIAFVGGRPFAVHMALSARWMVHYLNGDMLDRPDNRAEEQAFFETFDTGFAQRHAAALAAIDQRLGLDYFSIDCAETRDGRLLIFECDTGGVVHAMDPLGEFGYKREPMLRLFAAFRALLLRASEEPGCLKARASRTA